MSELQNGEDPEHSQPVPAGTLFVPVRPGSLSPCVRLFRTPLGGRTAVAFTTEQQLTTTLGSDQPWIRLCESAVRALAEPLGVSALTVDPQMAAPAAVKVPAAAQPVSARVPAAAQPVSARVPAAAQPVSARVPAAAQPVSARVPATSPPAPGRLPVGAQPTAARLPAAAQTAPAPQQAPSSPQPAGTAEAQGPPGHRRTAWDPKAAGALRVAGIAAVSCLSLFIG
jgi:hypothetical protein